MKKLFLNIFADENEELKILISYHFKKLFSMYHYNNESNYSIISYGISMISVNKIKDNNFEIKIFLTRPGMLIGKAGSNIEAIKNFILPYIREEVQFKFQKNIELEINLKELNPFDYSSELNYLKNKNYENIY